MKKLTTFFIGVTLGFMSLSANALLIDNGDNTLSSSTSGLMWLQDAGLAGEGVSWDDAFTVVANANTAMLGGYSDWRLSGGSDCNSRPSGANCFGSETFDLYWELLTEHSTSLYSAGSPFSNGLAGNYWTSTELTADVAMSVNFSNFGPDGAQMDYDKTSSFQVLLVRDGSGSGDDDVVNVPEPTTLTLLGLGIAGIGFVRRRDKK